MMSIDNLKNNILLAEDDTNFGMLMQSYLQIHDYKVTLCKNGEEALATFKSNKFDLCILDVMMPKMDGFTLANEIKKVSKHTPFIFLTAKSLKDDLLKGYGLGAEDYLIKPFDSDILLFKIQVILKRESNLKLSEEISTYKIGSFTFHSNTRHLLIENKTKKLSPKEAQLLILLCEYYDSNGILPREEALLKIWKEDDYFTTRSMDVHITKLRSYLKNDPIYSISIENIHSKGFRITVK